MKSGRNSSTVDPVSISNLAEAMTVFRERFEAPGARAWKDERIVEIGRGPRYQEAEGGAWHWPIPRSALFTLLDYAPRFHELLGQGYAWINLSCHGSVEEMLIMAIELPQKTSGAPRGRTSVNLSGPPMASLGWRSDGWIILEDGA